MFDAIVLAGGRSVRLGGADKPAVRVGDVSLLDRVISAVQGAEQIIVVGPKRTVAGDVLWRQEDPPGAGPVAAIAAGMAEVGADLVVVLAADLPWIGSLVPALLAPLRSAATPTVEVTVVVDQSGRRNHLAAAWRREALRSALATAGDSDDAKGPPARRLFASATVLEVTDAHGAGADCDSWDDIARARQRAEREGTVRE